MFGRRHREQIPELNTSSTADISFMLLIFFLVTSSMDTDKGLMRQLPPPPVEETRPTDINQQHVMTITLDANDQLTCDGTPVTIRELKQRVSAFVLADRREHVLALQTDRKTTYEAYYRLQNALVGVYRTLREQNSRAHFGQSYATLTEEQRNEVNEYYPQRISEQRPTEGGDRR